MSNTMKGKEIVTDGKINKHMYYHNKKIFTIVPPLSDADKNNLIDHINNIKKSYYKDDQCTFLWLLDKDTIMVDHDTKFVESDIFYQFSKIALWLFSKNYDLNGSFWYRTDRMIEYISCDGIGKSITHYIIFDEIDLLHFNDSNTYDKIIINTQDKIKNFKRIKFFDLMDKKNYIVKVEPLHNVTNMIAQTIESKVIIANMQSRLEEVENKLEALNNTNKSLWKVCTIMGIISIGTIIIFTLFSKDRSSAFYNSTLNQYNFSLP